MKTRSLTIIFAAGFLALSLTSAPARADIAVITYDLTTANISTGPGPLAQVTVDLVDSTHATLTYLGLSDSTYNYLLVDGGSVAANVAGSFLLGPITGTAALTGFNQATYSNGGAGNEDGFGSFNQTINSIAAYCSASQNISYSVTATGATTWSGITGVGGLLSPNAGGNFLAAHIAECVAGTGGLCVESNGAINTGFATGAVVTPEPSMIPPTSAFAGFIAFVYYRRRQIANR